ncbi:MULTISPECIES: hypothetical protein [Agrobacterium]|uniref:DUF4123 domain-containing protein n=1 Tax=Agrobacterium rosae TaxID=1972867 RepID=A0A1R3TMQ8_9HYPH|nr:hypothetical protein [Agrobacterium sp. DSM 25558]SCX09166.1 hypothetical protein DSM25559_0811 [Agrobacterium rosae]SCX19033.1 hypothetical protein DSM25558_2529 [Agrobacterium sp. DSM 25558]
MIPEAVDEKQLSSVAEAFLKSVSELALAPDQRVYAVMDGAQFSDLPRLLKEANVSHRPLYRYAGGDYAVILGGPWLINPYQVASPPSVEQASSADLVEQDLTDDELHARSAALSSEMVAALEAGDPTGGGVLPTYEGDPTAVVERLHRIIELSDGKPALVFWSGRRSLTEDKLHRHLRGINRISVPKIWRNGQTSDDGPHVPNQDEFAAAGGDEPVADEVKSGGHEMVIFRHADANVMMQTVPALDELQLGRLFGPATQLQFAPDAIWGGGVKRARRQSDMAPPAGVLTLDSHAMQTMSALRLEISRKKVMAYLRETDPDNNNYLSDADLLKKTVFYEADGKVMGLRSERAHAQWAFLMSTTDGAIGEEQEIRTAVKTSRNPDQTLSDIMQEMVKIGQAETQGKRILGS